MPRGVQNVVRLGYNNRWARWNDTDPDLEFVCSIMEKSGMAAEDISDEIYRSSAGLFRVSASHIKYNILQGKVRRPRNSTIAWIACVCGFERVWRRI